MDNEQFRKYAHELVDWMADYLDQIEKYPVKSQVEPGEIIKQLPDSPPEQPETFEQIFADFQNIIMPGITHWQHPKFFGYFPANSSPPSLLAEMLTSTLAPQCMIWQTSPAAAELEEQVMKWLIQMLALPKNWSGVIQDTASTATLCSILTAREQKSNYEINKSGLSNNKFRIYCSSETHSSIEKAIKIAGMGSDNLRLIDVDENFAMNPKALEAAINDDLKNNLTPLCVIATIGTTGSTAVDPVKAIGEICTRHKIWYHIDAAYSGTALLLPEMRWMIEGIEQADSFVFNPHKWMFTNFDCSAYFVKDEEALVKTFEILPEYLKTAESSQVKNYRDWGIPLGRRFRALKLWFVIRSYGQNGLQEKIRYHISLAKNLAEKINNSNSFEMMAPVSVNMVCFRFHPENINDELLLDDMNSKLLNRLNQSGQMFLTHTKLNNKYVIRLQCGQTNVNQRHLDDAWNLIQQYAAESV